MITNLLSAKLIAILIAILLAFGGVTWVGYKIYTIGAQTVQSKWDKVEADRNAIINTLKEESIKTEADLKASAEKQQKASNEKIANLNKSLAVAIAGLSNRPSRPSSTDLPKDSTSPIGATGAELYRPDAEFLIGEATRAEKVRLQLETCTAQYNSVYEAFNK